MESTVTHLRSQAGCHSWLSKSEAKLPLQGTRLRSNGFPKGLVMQKIGTTCETNLGDQENNALKD